MTTLILSPHADDEVLGVGGTMARLAADGERVVVAVLTGHGEDEHPLWTLDLWERIREECAVACSLLGIEKPLFRELPASCLDMIPAWRTNSVVDELVEEVKPDTLYVPFANDLHRDHGAIAYAASVASRGYLPRVRGLSRVLAYETLSETHLAPPYLEPAFQPNSFNDITGFLDVKLDAMSAYRSQVQESNMPRSLECLKALATLRGAHVGVAAAEAFVLLRETT